MQAMSDEKLRYWLDFHVERIRREAGRADRYRNPDGEERRSEEYLADLIGQCETTIWHSERSLTGLRAEAARRGMEVTE
jgi:hypothetical protein